MPFAAQAQQGSPTPPVYEAARATAPVAVDGDLFDPAWRRARWSPDFVDIRGADGPSPALRTRVKLLWDDRYLYVGAWMEEPHLWATLTRRDAIVYRDDDFEVFLDPDGDGEAYFEIEINPLGTVLDLFLDRPYSRGGRADLGWDLPGLQASVALRGTVNDPSDEDEGWAVEMAIPWEELTPPGISAGAAPEPGDSWRVNFSRVDWPLVTLRSPESGEGIYRKDTGRARPGEHPESNWVWSPQGTVNMHLPERWGVVRFVDERRPGGIP